MSDAEKVRKHLAYMLREDAQGDEQIFKEVWEDCDDPDAVIAEINRIADWLEEKAGG